MPHLAAFSQCAEMHSQSASHKPGTQSQSWDQHAAQLDHASAWTQLDHAYAVAAAGRGVEYWAQCAKVIAPVARQ